MLLISNGLDKEKAELSGHKGDVKAGEVGLDGRGQEDGVDGGRDQEQQDALDEGDEGEVEEVEGKLGNVLPDNLPVISCVSDQFICRRRICWEDAYHL